MTSCNDSLGLEAGSLFETSFLYQDDSNLPIDLTGLVNDADFTLYQGDVSWWIGTMTSGEITATLSQGRFDLLIPETAVSLFTFTKVKYRFRIRWITKGWQSLADGAVIRDV